MKEMEILNGYEIVDGKSRKNLEELNFKTPQMFGAVGDGVNDDTQAFQNAVNTITEGGLLYVPNGTYLLNGEVDFTNFSGNVITSPDADFIGEGRLGKINGQGWYEYKGAVFTRKPVTGKVSPGGIYYGQAALTANVIPNNDYHGDSVGVIATNKALPGAKGRVWGMNTAVEAKDGFTESCIGMEIDVNSYVNKETSEKPIIIGLGITGIGDGLTECALRLDKQDNSTWLKGLTIADCLTGIIIDKPNSGITVDDPNSVGIAVISDEVTPYANFMSVGGERGAVISKATQVGISLADQPIGIKVNEDVGLGIELNNRGIKFSNVGTTIYKYYKTIKEITFGEIPAHSAVEKTVYLNSDELSSFGLSPDCEIRINPFKNPGDGLMWCARLQTTGMVVRLANVTDAPITPNTVKWIIRLTKDTVDA